MTCTGFNTSLFCGSKWLCGALVGFAIWATIGSAFGQMTTGTILGRVTDTSGASIPGAKVTITNTGTGISKSFVTGSDGSYVVPYLIPGMYAVSAEKQGFRMVTKSGIVLEVGQTARIDMTLPVGSVTQQVTVRTQSPLLQTQSSEQGTVIAGQKIVSMPLNLREFAALVNLTPGTTPNAVGGDIGSGFGPDNPQAIDSSSVNGLESDANNWTIDGISDNEAFFSILTVNPSLDAIQEFKVDNNNYSAEFGRAGGANVQIAIKSGTNQLHGDAFEFFRNSGLEANNFFSNRSGQPIPPYRQNQFGANLGGPIIRNRTFFFVDYEGLRTRLGQTGLLVIPTMAQREGDFSAAGNPTIYNPFNVNPATGQPEPFTGNTIPPNLINPAAAKIMALFPAPNISAPLGQPNFFGSSSLAHNIDEGDVRIDHRLSDKDQLMGRYSLLRTTYLNPPFLGTAIGGGPGLTATAYTRNQNAVIGETHTLSPITLNEFRLGVNRVNTNWYGLDRNLQTSNEVGIPGINNFCGVCGGLPSINIVGFSTFGHTPFAPTLRHDTTFEFVDNMTFIRGKHTIKVGADIQRIQANLFQTDNPIGEFDFNQENTSLHGASGTGSGLAGFLLGYPDFAGRAALTDFPSNRDTQAFFFGQDDYRITHRLTLNLGLRWEYYAPVTDAWSNMANFNLTTGNIQLACVAISCSGGIEPDLHDFAPRLGFAYAIGHSRRTVLRGGFGISYFYPGYGGANLGTLDDNFPFVQGQGLAPANFFTVTPGDPVLTSGLPPLPPPQQRPGAPPGNLIPTGGATAGAFSSVFYMPSNLSMSHVYQWSLDLQRELSSNLMLSVAYVGNRANNLFLNLPGNYPEPGVVTSTGLTLQEARPYFKVDPGLAGFTKRILGGTSVYNSLQAELQKRTSYGLSFLASYTWEHDLGRGQHWVNPDFYMAQKSNIGGVPAQTFVLSYTYQLPFGQGEHFGANWNRWTNAVLGGWELSGITSYNTGLPFNPTVTSTLDNGNGDMPNRICNGTVSNPSIQEWFNPSCFAIPGRNQFGNSGFNILYGPSFEDWDMALMKNIHISESKYFQFRAEFYNTFNEVNFGQPNSLVCTACATGTITGLASNYTPRLIQFGLKLYY
jgi:hypothetical protein